MKEIKTQTSQQMNLGGIEVNRIYCGDCLEVMKNIPDKSVDLVLTDPPYNISKAKWDKIKNYIEWSGKWLKESERILKDNGSLYFFHNDMPQIAELMVWIKKNTKFIFNSFIIWDKGDFRSLSWKKTSKNNNLRCWFNVCEYILYYTFQDETGLSQIMLDVNNFPTLRKYFKDLQEYIGINTYKQINKILGHRRAEHAFYWLTSQWNLPTREVYQELIEVFKIDKWKGFREYESLRQEYESLRQEYESLRYVHNLDPNHNNVWRSQYVNNGLTHPTEKPLDIIERIIKTSSNAGGITLDPFAGSGTTAVACKNLHRNFICIEIDKKYCEIAQKRLENTTPYFPKLT